MLFMDINNELSGVIIFRGNWEISRREPRNPQFLGMVSADHDYVDTDFDEYPAPSPRSLMCCRVIAIIVIPLLYIHNMYMYKYIMSALWA